MGHDHHDNHGHHHVDDLSGFSIFRVLWPAALLLLVVLVTKNCCCGGGACAGDSCEKPGAKKEMHKDHGKHEGGHEEHAAEGAHH